VAALVWGGLDKRVSERNCGETDDEESAKVAKSMVADNGD
jgi:hypothetical protein